MCQARNYVALDRYAMCIDFLVEGFAQFDDIAACAGRLLGLFRVEP